MIGKFLWGAAWRTLAFSAVVAAPIWYANRGSDWSADDLIAKGDTKIVGKAGVIVVALMQPETFDPKFFENFLEKLFTQVIPWPVSVFAGGDAGIALIDPSQPYRDKRFEPKRLADIWGSEKDIDGVPWIEKYRKGQLRWEDASNEIPKDIGYFLYPARKQGMRTAAAKSALKARYIYYARLPGNTLPHYRQTHDMAAGAIAEARKRYPIIAGEVADAFDPYAKEQAVLRVLDAGADTLILASAQPIYSSFEELEGSFVSIHKIVEKWRKAHNNKPIKIVVPPYLASTPAYDALILDHFAASVPEASAPGQSAMGILTLHGLPTSQMDTDSWVERSKVIGKRLLPKAEAVLRAKGYAKVEVALGAEAFADAIEDPDNQIVSVNELYRRAAKLGFAVATAVPLEFLAENTDSLFGHQAFFFDGMPGYSDYLGPPPSTDWSRPYRRQLKLGQTIIIYGGAPGGSTVPSQASALADAIGAVFMH